MIAAQIGGKAVRDAFFLSSYPVERLPAMVAAAAALSIVVSALAVKAMTRWGPRRVVPAAFAASAALQIGEWLLAGLDPRLAAVAVFLHVAALGPVLTSGFWSVSGERLDPRSARRMFGRIAAAGAFGGVVGGLAGERVASFFGLAGTLLLLAALHLLCGWLVLRLGAGGVTAAPDRDFGWRESLRSIARVSYVRRVVAIMLLVSLSAALVDYVFKSQAAGAAERGVDLMRIFSAFYVGTSILTFLIAGLAAPFLRRIGLGRTMGMLPAAVAMGGVGALAFPGLATAAVVRGVEAVFRNSLFRAGYEVLFAPFPRGIKRATKTLIDVGGERIGDALGAGVVAITLLALPSATGPALLVLAILASALTLWLARSLHRGYVESLEENLVRGAVDMESLPVDEQATRATLFRTLGATGWDSISQASIAALRDRAPRAPHREPGSAPARSPDDPVEAMRFELRSGDPARVRRVLAGTMPAGAVLPDLIPLLAWDDVAPEVIATLRRTDPKHLGALVGALVDPSRPFAVRRRIPQVLMAFPRAESVRGLLEGLTDTRFEVRYRCGRALRHLADDDPALAPDADSILAAVGREASVGRGVWASQRLIDHDSEPERAGLLDEVLRERANSSLAHVFTLLSLAYSREAVRLAFRGLHTDDPMARGTALEYIESLLPRDIWSSLRPFLDDDRSVHSRTRPSETVLVELMHARESIEARLEALRDARRTDRSRRDPAGPEG